MRKSIFILFFLSLSVSGFSQSPKIKFHHREFEANDGRTALNCDARSETGFVLYDLLGSCDEVFFYPSYHTTIGPICYDYFGLTFDAHTSSHLNDLKKKIESGNRRLPFVILFQDSDEALSGYCDCKFTESGLIEVTFGWGGIVSKKFPDFEQSRSSNALRHHVNLLSTKDIVCFTIDYTWYYVWGEMDSSNSAVFFNALFDHGAEDYDKYGRRSSDSVQADVEAPSPFKFRSTCTVEDLLLSPLGMGINVWGKDPVSLKKEIERCTQWEVSAFSEGCGMVIKPTSLTSGDCFVRRCSFACDGQGYFWYMLYGSRGAIMNLAQEITNFFKKSGFTLRNDSKIAADEVLFEKDAYSQTTHYRVAASRDSGEIEYTMLLVIDHTKSWEAGQL